MLAREQSGQGHVQGRSAVRLRPYVSQERHKSYERFRKRINQCVVSKYSSFEDVDEAPPAIELPAARAPSLRNAFASYGRPLGLCLPDGRTLTGMRPLRQTKCHAKDSMELVEKACLNKPSCVVSLAHNNRRKNKSSDPCPGKVKRLAVKMECSIEYHPDTESILSGTEGGAAESRR